MKSLPRAPPPCAWYLMPRPRFPMPRELDRDGSGTISIEELSDALKRFGIFDDAKKLLDTADTNGEPPGSHNNGLPSTGALCVVRSCASICDGHDAWATRHTVLCRRVLGVGCILAKGRAHTSRHILTAQAGEQGPRDCSCASFVVQDGVTRWQRMLRPKLGCAPGSVILGTSKDVPVLVTHSACMNLSPGAQET